MDRYHLLKQKFDTCSKVVGATFMSFNNSLILEHMARREDLDYILFDAEHGVFDSINLIPCLQTLRLLGLPSLVRVPDSQYPLISRYLDIGSDGIMLPRTETLEQVRTAVEAMRFYPLGKKGVGGHAQFRPGEKFEDFASTRFLLLQIETPEGIRNLPNMIERYGEHISAIVVGPYDLSVMVGTPLDISSPAVLDSIQQVFDIAKSYGKSCGIFCDDEVKAKLYRSMGANVLWLSADREYFMRGFNQMMDGTTSL